jgi:hypothetical protein
VFEQEEHHRQLHSDMKGSRILLKRKKRKEEDKEHREERGDRKRDRDRKTENKRNKREERKPAIQLSSEPP